MSCSPSQLVSNLANARKSTGPKSASGKAKASMNALSHGFYCAEPVAKGEDPAAYEDLRQKLIKDFSPQDTIELLIIDRIAVNTWKLQRVQRAEQEFYGDNVHFNEPRGAGRAMWLDIPKSNSTVDRLGRMEQRLENNIFRAIRELTKLRKARKAEGELPRTPFLRNEANGEAQDQVEEPSSVTRASRPCLVHEDKEKGGAQTNPHTPITGETPVSQGSISTNVKNEANPEVDDANRRNEPNEKTHAASGVGFELVRMTVQG